MVVVYVTFLFGPGLPILFPIAYFSLLGLYIVERLMMAYSYRKPPMTGTVTNQTVMKMLLGAPIVYCCMAMWLFSNRQVFENKVITNEAEFLFANTDHFMGQFLTTITPGTIFFILLIVLSVVYLGKWVIKKFRICTDPAFAEQLAKGDVSVQNLQPFYKSLRTKQVKGLLKEEKICREKLHFNRLTEETYF